MMPCVSLWVGVMLFVVAVVVVVFRYLPPLPQSLFFFFSLGTDEGFHGALPCRDSKYDDACRSLLRLT